jgi:hypothetical protein
MFFELRGNIIRFIHVERNDRELSSRAKLFSESAATDNLDLEQGN